MPKVSIFVLSLFIAVLAGCATQKRCNTKFPPSVDSIYKYVVKDSIVVKDTTIYIYLPGAVVHDSIEIPCPDPGPAYIPKKVYAETSLAKASAWFQWPNIKLELIQKDTTIEARLENAIKEMYHYKNLYTNVTNTLQPVKYVPGFYKFCTFAFIGICLTLIGYIVLRIFVLK